MLKDLRKVIYYMLIGANIATIGLMALTGFSDRFSPDAHPLLSVIGLGFPVFLLINLTFLVFWVLFKFRTALVPMAGFIACLQPIRTYAPVNLNTRAPEDCLTIMSYNVYLFAGWATPKGEKNEIADYICRSGADIVCLQEGAYHEIQGEDVHQKLKSIYQYCDTADKDRSNSILAIFSKHPIIKRERIKYESLNNHSIAHWLKIGEDTVIVVNNHLETNGLTEEAKSGFKSIISGNLLNSSAKNHSKLLIEQLTEATRRRMRQADKVAEFIRAHKNEKIILCGDFNDNPISYAHRTIAKELNDCYIASGNGPGFSFHENFMYVRIDNIMCSSHWQPYNCFVDKSIGMSDHYPIVCKLALKTEENQEKHPTE